MIDETAKKSIKLEKIMNFKGKNVVYVGGYGGIGLECCKEMISKGIQVSVRKKKK